MSPPPNSPPGSGSAAQSQDHVKPALSVGEYSSEERQLLLGLAHQAIDTALEGSEPTLPAISEHLQQHRGAFTTLHLEGDVRGCVGYVFPVAPLFQTIIETARAAAFQDMRFLPVTREEAAQLQISISVLSPLFSINVEELELGKHGLLVTQGNRRGLLLPQVPAEHGWDRKTFLEQTCRKAGLPPDAWQHEATLEAFTAEIFGEGVL
ncbi:MAG TPA: AmmeMemoRadiSam system protein A [Terriglobales bacterium]|nr:AmmeMemoRadiSam system protein A [Terriglobales bacterium]